MSFLRKQSTTGLKVLLLTLGLCASSLRHSDTGTLVCDSGQNYEGKPSYFSIYLSFTGIIYCYLWLPNKLYHFLHEICVESCAKEILVSQESPRKDESDTQWIQTN